LPQQQPVFDGPSVKTTDRGRKECSECRSAQRFSSCFIERDGQGRDRRTTRHDGTTVYRLLALKESPRYEREQRASLLDPHKAKIAELLTLDAEAPVVAIDYLRRQGYPGGFTILKDYLQEDPLEAFHSAWILRGYWGRV